MPERYDVPDVVALAILRRRIVDLEEELEQVAIRQPLRIEDDLDRLGMRAVIAVRRVRHVAAAVADARRDDAGQLADQVLHAPEAAARENRRFSLSHMRPPLGLAEIRRSSDQRSTASQLLDEPIELGALDDERRREPDDLRVRVLREHAALERAARRTRAPSRRPPRSRCRRASRGRESSAMHGARSSRSFCEQVLALRGRALGEPLVDEHAQRGVRPTAAASGLPPNVLPWSPGRSSVMIARLASTADTG